MSGIVGQNTLDNSGLIKAPAGGGAWNFIAKQTASASADISFTSGIDSTYKEYIFTFKDIHPSDDGETFTVNFRDGSTAYDAVKTTTSFRAYHDEAGSATGFAYVTSEDLAQGTGVQNIANSGSDNDQSCAGYLHLFNPSSTTFVKHFIIRTSSAMYLDYINEWHIAGYCNTTTAIDGVQFSFASGTIDAGDICLYGIST